MAETHFGLGERERVKPDRRSRTRPRQRSIKARRYWRLTVRGPSRFLVQEQT
jgi:hypothetical protein